ncbi:MAG TPA: hypothetical protein VKH19_01320 [Gemmatimonadaceae bacterium]|nr:hypothetical protein [Gemmatimonadaceae bacterium]
MRPSLSFILAFTVAPLTGSGAQIALSPASSTRHTGPWSFDIGAQMAQPIGDFATQIDRAWGVGGTLRYRLPHASAVGVRGDLTWLNYGNERKTVPLSPTINRVLVDMNTTNDIAVFAAGPELAVSRGPLRPYAFGFAGYSYFYTATSVGDDNTDGSAFAESTNYHDGGLSTGWGGGIRVPIVLRSAELAVDAGGRLTRNGVRSYLRRGDIVDQSSGSYIVNPRTTTADFWQYHVAISIAPKFR